VDKITPNSMVLFNESFAATNEREGSEIARQVVGALLQRRIKVFYVTHLYEFAHGVHDELGENTMFLRAERRSDGTRPFRLAEGEPQETSYGGDLYERIFGARGQAVALDATGKLMGQGSPSSVQESRVRLYQDKRTSSMKGRREAVS